MSEYRRKRSRFRRPRFCAFCADKKVIDYKQPEMFRRYVTSKGKIRPRRQSGLCAKHQRNLALHIKRARHIALLGFVGGN